MQTNREVSMRMTFRILPLTVAAAAVLACSACSSEEMLPLDANVYIPDSVVDNSMELSAIPTKSGCICLMKMKVDSLSRRELFKKVEKYYKDMGFKHYEAFKQVTKEIMDKSRRDGAIHEGSLEDRALKEEVANTFYVIKGNLHVMADIRPFPERGDAKYMEKTADGDMVCRQYLIYTICVDPNPPLTIEQLRKYTEE
jgi:hypothetical protein